MKFIYIIIIGALSLSSAYAQNDLSCTGDINTVNVRQWPEVFEIHVNVLDSNMDVRFLDRNGLHVAQGFVEPDIMSFQLILIFKNHDQEYGIIVDLMTLEGKLLWGGEPFALVKCRYL
ncbi:MAG: hypothetical protein A2381_03215 [Bdellovibrionales bacterium RIFOXYB1_FULL_37_110]|nr:MAG: hypothetical protein A2181_00320 [Bdellovibrionales bacterium RIFOXYA1_FULL_38_20]OFZ48415.1 MAG: hypothetical protein A2417_03705 [Bdellovibrionales bacterium RIFOXYC1_FULL_37_79]OFZ57936.1 MAG: hypothetical protein A2381_03215 [Bdellovibrionales bacterium RIFOXYB1_FULL_37_110]OFZ63073.1 MAG: hypothetical protein A2577_15345 [Bdellovibrionales bacterium RIFOXYD1_FULL_36_51]